MFAPTCSVARSSHSSALIFVAYTWQGHKVFISDRPLSCFEVSGWVMVQKASLDRTFEKMHAHPPPVERVPRTKPWNIFGVWSLFRVKYEEYNTRRIDTDFLATCSVR